MTYELGRLEQVELRKAWTTESGEFTPWLAHPDNLALLGKTIGLELECEAKEKNVGPFRADILCRDTTTRDWVLIENQLERTDHSHLGQLLTYAAGLKAVTIVWIAERFTEEHRAALDWLNDITDERFSFFGLEIELWRIGSSPVAPKFNIACKPNDWSKTAASAADGPLSDTSELYLEYWQALKSHLDKKKSPVQMSKPLPQMWMNFAVGRSYFQITASVSRQKGTGFVQLGIYGPDHIGYFHLLSNSKAVIESELSEPIEWRELPDGKESHIRKWLDKVDVDDREDWPRQHQQIQESLERFAKCFRPRVKALEIESGETERATALT